MSIRSKFRGMDPLKQMREERVELRNEMADLVDTAKSTKLSDSQVGRMQRIEDEIKELDREIEVLEAKEERAARGARKAFQMVMRGRGVDVDLEDRLFLDTAKTISIISNKQKLARPVEFGEEDKEQVGLGELIMARIAGPKTAAQKAALDTTLGADGGIETRVSRNFWDLARAKSTVVAAGASFLDFESGEHGSVTVPKILADPAVQWKQQNTDGNLVEPTFGSETFAFKTLFAAIQLSNELIQDGGTMLARMIETSLAGAFGQEIDRVGLYGSGAGEEPEGLSQKNGVGVITMANNPLTDYNPVVFAISDLMGTNTDLENISYIMAPRSWRDLTAVRVDSQAGMYLPPPLNIADVPYYVSSKVPTNQGGGSETEIWVGDFSQLVFGVRLSLKVKFFEQPMARAYSTLVVAAARVDLQCVREDAFVKITGIAPSTITLT